MIKCITYYIFINLFINLRYIYAIPQINTTNPYYEKHLEHVNSI